MSQKNNNTIYLLKLNKHNVMIFKSDENDIKKINDFMQKFKKAWKDESVLIIPSFIKIEERLI